MTDQTDTPRTDYILSVSDKLAGVKDVAPFAVQELCRQLERELAAANARIAKLDEEIDAMIQNAIVYRRQLREQQIAAGETQKVDSCHPADDERHGNQSHPAAPEPEAWQSFGAWLENPYTKSLLKSIKDGYVPRFEIATPPPNAGTPTGGQNMFKDYRKIAVQSMRPYIQGEDLNGISVNKEDTPEQGGMIAVNAKNPEDKWYVAKKFFDENYEPVERLAEPAPVKVCTYDSKPCPLPIQGRGKGNSQCEQNGVCQRVNFGSLPRLQIAEPAPQPTLPPEPYVEGMPAKDAIAELLEYSDALRAISEELQRENAELVEENGLLNNSLDNRNSTIAWFAQQVEELKAEVEKLQRENAELLDILKRLTELKAIKRRIEANQVSLSAASFYEANKEQAWLDAESVLISVIAARKDSHD